VIDSQNDGRMLIRSRCKADIHNLYREHAAALSSMTPPTSDESRDYRWRISLSKADFVTLASRLAEAVDYSNFKSAVAKRPDQANNSGPLHEVWAVMAGLQWEERAPAKRKARKANLTSRFQNWMLISCGLAGTLSDYFGSID
jgi:hypothetical protein